MCKKCTGISGSLFFFTLCVIMTFNIQDSIAQKTATTEDGKKVILLDNGTWKYAPASDIETRKKVSAPDNTKSQAKPVKTSQDISTIVDELRSSTSFDFRKVKWGMSVSQVKQSEKLKLIEQKKEALTYDHSLIGMKCKIFYTFSGGKLSSARYTIQQKHHNPALFNRDFIALKKHLRRILGTPAMIQDNWKNDQFKSNQSQWGFAVSIGFLTRLVAWRKSGSKIVLQMEGQNHEIHINIKYNSLK